MTPDAEDAHVGPDLGDDDLRAAPLNTGDRAQQFNVRSERAGLLLDRVGEPVDLLVQEIDVREDRTDPQGMHLVKAALKGLAQRGELDPQAALGEVGQNLRVGGAVDQRVEHRATGDPENVRGDAVQLDPGVLQRLMQTVGLPLALLDLGLAIPGEVPQRTDRLRRHEARSQQPSLRELAQPFGVLNIGLSTQNLLYVSSIDQHQLESVLQDRPYRLPEHSGRLHRDLFDTMGFQPITQRQQTPHRRLKLGHMLLTATPLLGGHPHTRGHLLLMNIQRRRTLNNRLHETIPQSSIDTIAAQGPQEQTSLTGVLKATVRSSGETHTPN